MKQAKMVDLLTDIMLLEAGNQVQYNMGNIPATIWKRDYAFVCKKHQLDTALFHKTMDWYEMHPEAFSKTLELVITRLQKKEIESHKAKL